MSNVKVKTPAQIAEERAAQLRQQIDREAAERILINYPEGAIPGRYEGLTQQQRNAIDNIGRQIAQKARELKQEVAQSRNPVFGDDAVWPGRGKGRNRD